MSWWLTSCLAKELKSLSSEKAPSHSRINICGYTLAHLLQNIYKAWSFFLLIKVSSQIQRIELYPHHTSHCLYGVMLFFFFYHFNRTLMPFPICKGSNVSVLESFQHIDELACIQNCDKCNQKHANWWKVALIWFFFFCLSSEVIYIRMVLFVFCMLLIPSLVLHQPITLQNYSPLWRLLNHNVLHLFFFCERDLFFFHFSVSKEFAAVLSFCADLIQFRLKQKSVLTQAGSAAADC